MFFYFIFFYFIKTWRKNRKRRLLRQKNDTNGIKLKRFRKDVEKNMPEVDGYESDAEDQIVTRSSTDKAIMLWGIVEIISLIVLLIKRSKDENYENFLSGFCEGIKNRCNGIVTKIIYYKLLTAVTLVIGAKYRMVFLMVPWFVINVLGIFPNVLGIFPYSLVATSAIWNYSDLNIKWDTLVNNWFFSSFGIK